jgi:Spy/CpxP family protein refolding chaperone
MLGGNGGGRMDGRRPGRMGFLGGDGPAPTARGPVHTTPMLGLPGRWWDDNKVARRLKLRSDQRQRMDDVFEANKATLVTLLGTLQREENNLNSLSSRDLQDENKVFAAIDRVSQARAELEKATTHIMLQIRQQMDTPQLAELDREIADQSR